MNGEAWPVGWRDAFELVREELLAYAEPGPARRRAQFLLVALEQTVQQAIDDAVDDAVFQEQAGEDI